MAGYNAEHYKDPTPCEAMSREAKEAWRARAREAIYAARATLRAHGFEAVGRIAIIDRKTGKIF